MSSNVLKTERSQKWDILRFFLIFTVVLGHAADNYTGAHEHIRSLFFFIYIFHMPVFIFVSGLFAKKNIQKKRFDKLFGYITVYIVLKIYVYLIKLLAGKDPELNFLVEGGAPWFMLALFAFNLITIAVRKLPPVAVFSVSIVLACVIGYFNDVRDFLAFARIVVYYPFFYLGYCIDRNMLEEFCENKSRKIISAIILVATAVTVFVMGDEIYWLRYLLTGRNPYYISIGDGNPVKTTPEINENLGFVFRLLYFAAVIIIGLSLIIIIPKKTPYGICAKLGQRTLSVYGFHFGALYLIFKILKLKPVFADIFGTYNEWIIVPIAILVTLLFSMKFFNDALTLVMKLPVIVVSKIKSNHKKSLG